ARRARAKTPGSMHRTAALRPSPVFVAVDLRRWEPPRPRACEPTWTATGPNPHASRRSTHAWGQRRRPACLAERDRRFDDAARRTEPAIADRRLARRILAPRLSLSRGRPSLRARPLACLPRAATRRLGAGPSHLPPVPQTPRVTSGRQKNRSVRPASSLPPRPAPRGPGSAVPVDAAIWVPPAEPDSPGADGLSASGGAALAVALAFAAGAHVTA